MENLNECEIVVLGNVYEMLPKQGIIITEHASERMRERLGWKASAQKRMVQKVWTEGLPIECTKGKIRRFLENKKANSLRRHYTDYRVYGDNLFIFSGRALVTVFSITQVERNFRDPSYKRSKYKDFDKYLDEAV